MICYAVTSPSSSNRKLNAKHMRNCNCYLQKSARRLWMASDLLCTCATATATCRNHPVVIESQVNCMAHAQLLLLLAETSPSSSNRKWIAKHMHNCNCYLQKSARRHRIPSDLLCNLIPLLITLITERLMKNLWWWQLLFINRSEYKENNWIGRFDTVVDVTRHRMQDIKWACQGVGVYK